MHEIGILQILWCFICEKKGWVTSMNHRHFYLLSIQGFKVQILLIASKIDDFSSKKMFLYYFPQSSFAQW